MTRKRPRRASWCPRCGCDTLPDADAPAYCASCFAPTKARAEDRLDWTPDDEADA